MSVRTIGRLEAGQRSPTREERELIAKVCEVPADFLEAGFAPMTRPLTDLGRRVLAIEEHLGMTDGRDG